MAKIMLVDDAAFMRTHIRNILKYNGYRDFVEAGDGVVSVEKYLQEKPDVVIMDITMPHKDGLQALREIMAADAGARILMCTAMGQEGIMADAIQNGARDFIVKPFDPERMAQAVNAVFEEQ